MKRPLDSVGQKWDTCGMSKPRMSEFRVRNVPPGEHKRVRIAAKQCKVSVSDFCRAAINIFCGQHEKEPPAKRRATKEKP